MCRFTQNEELRINNPQGGNRTCGWCGTLLPRSKKKKYIYMSSPYQIVLFGSFNLFWKSLNVNFAKFNVIFYSFNVKFHSFNVFVHSFNA